MTLSSKTRLLRDQRPGLANGSISVYGCVSAVAMVIVLCSGCVHRQLERNTALAATTVCNIQYRMVLDNIAMMSCNPASLPSHVRLADGTVQISNNAGFGEAGGFTILDGSGFGTDQFGPAASTKVSEQWGTDAVGDPIQIFALQTIYRKAFGLEPLEEPNFITAGKKSRKQEASNKTGSDDESAQDQGEESRSSDDQQATEDLDVSDFDIPVGWFVLGCKDDVPKEACYVGRFRNRYAWVMPGDVHDLAKFTLAVLTIVKLESGEVDGSSGLMFTP